MKFLIVNLLFFSTSIFAAREHHVVRKRNLSGFSDTDEDNPLQLRGVTFSQPSTISEGSGSRTPPESIPPSPREDPKPAFNPAAHPKNKVGRSKSIDRGRPPAIPGRPRVEPLPQKMVEKLKRLPKPEGDGLANLSLSPFEVPPGSRQNNLLARPVMGSPPRSPRAPPRHAQQALFATEKPSPESGPPQNLQDKGHIASSPRPPSPRKKGDSDRSSFAFDNAQASSSTPERSPTPQFKNLHGMNRQPSGFPTAKPRIGAPKLATQSDILNTRTPRSEDSPSLLPISTPSSDGGPTLSQSPKSVQNTVRNLIASGGGNPMLHQPSGTTTTTSPNNSNANSLSMTAAAQPTSNSWGDRLMRGIGAQSYYGDSNPGAITALGASAGAGAITVAGVALSATHVAGHAVAGPLVVAAGVTGAVLAQAYGHVSNVRNHANERQFNLDQLRDRGRQARASVARGTSNTFRAPMRALSNQFRSISSVPADMNTMASLRRRGTGF